MRLISASTAAVVTDGRLCVGWTIFRASYAYTYVYTAAAHPDCYVKEVRFLLSRESRNFQGKTDTTLRAVKNDPFCLVCLPIGLFCVALSWSTSCEYIGLIVPYRRTTIFFPRDSACAHIRACSSFLLFFLFFCSFDFFFVCFCLLRVMRAPFFSIPSLFGCTPLTNVMLRTWYDARIMSWNVPGALL